MPLTDIPDDFGTGGSGINPTGNEPTLKTLLIEHRSALENLQNTVVESVHSVNNGSTTLVDYDASENVQGSLIYVETVGAYFKLTNSSSFTVDNLTVVDALGLSSGWQWIRINQHNQKWEAQTTWFIDPQNAYGTSHDENDGLTSATALRSYA